jgi:hypothetical protein
MDGWHPDATAPVEHAVDGRGRDTGVAREVADIGFAPRRRFMIRVAAHCRNLSELRSNYIILFD